MFVLWHFVVSLSVQTGRPHPHGNPVHRFVFQGMNATRLEEMEHFEHVFVIFFVWILSKLVFCVFCVFMSLFFILLSLS